MEPSGAERSAERAERSRRSRAEPSGAERRQPSGASGAERGGAERGGAEQSCHRAIWRLRLKNAKRSDLADRAAHGRSLAAGAVCPLRGGVAGSHTSDSRALPTPDTPLRPSRDETYHRHTITATPARRYAHAIFPHARPTQQTSLRPRRGRAEPAALAQLASCDQAPPSLAQLQVATTSLTCIAPPARGPPRRCPSPSAAAPPACAASGEPAPSPTAPPLPRGTSRRGARGGGGAAASPSAAAPPRPPPSPPRPPPSAPPSLRTAPRAARRSPPRARRPGASPPQAPPRCLRTCRGAAEMQPRYSRDSSSSLLARLRCDACRSLSTAAHRPRTDARSADAAAAVACVGTRVGAGQSKTRLSSASGSRRICVSAAVAA